MKMPIQSNMRQKVYKIPLSKFCVSHLLLVTEPILMTPSEISLEKTKCFCKLMERGGSWPGSGGYIFLSNAPGAL